MEVFNEHYISRVEKLKTLWFLSLRNSSDAFQNEMTVKQILSVYGDHPSFPKIENFCVPNNKFDLQNPRTSGIKMIKPSNKNKA